MRIAATTAALAATLSMSLPLPALASSFVAPETGVQSTEAANHGKSGHKTKHKHKHKRKHYGYKSGHKVKHKHVVVHNHHHYHLPPPPPGQRYVRVGDQILRVMATTMVVVGTYKIMDELLD